MIVKRIVEKRAVAQETSVEKYIEMMKRKRNEGEGDEKEGDYDKK